MSDQTNQCWGRQWRTHTDPDATVWPTNQSLDDVDPAESFFSPMTIVIAVALMAVLVVLCWVAGWLAVHSAAQAMVPALVGVSLIKGVEDDPGAREALEMLVKAIREGESKRGTVDEPLAAAEITTALMIGEQVLGQR